MAKGSLIIVANEEAKQTLVELARPTVDVSVRGTIVQEGGQSVLVVDSIESQRHTNIPIVASAATRQKLSEIANSKSGQEVSLEGRIADVEGGSALILDEVATVTSLPIVASEGAQQLLAELASNGDAGEEITVRAKVSGKGDRRVLLLESQ